MRGVTSKGFTLVELAIVLVIIGIILGGVLKGQAIIENARIKRVQNDLKSIEASMWTFYDRYNRMPGDCDRNGTIDAYTSNTGYNALDNNPDEGFCASTASDADRDRPWAELKAARILSQNADNRNLSLTQFGARLVIGRANAGSGTVYVNAIAVADIPCYAAKAIDSSIDGGLDAGQGRIRELTAAYRARNTSDTWTSCTTEDTVVDIVYFFDKLP